jgi:dATP pyrophosphohydrolase
MARAPFQVLVLPYRRHMGRVEYAAFRRADNDAWQGIAGGGENDETPRDAAIREMREEAGITSTDTLRQLDAVGTIGVEHFHDRHSWDAALREIPEYAFGVAVDGSDISLSSEHCESAWLTFEESLVRLVWESNRIALRELHDRLSVVPDANFA